MELIKRDNSNFKENQQKNLKFSDFEISEFIGNFNNDEIIKQFYLVDNIKTKINNIYNDNFEDLLKKDEMELMFKQFEKIAGEYLKERDGILKEYVKNANGNLDVKIFF